MKKIEEIFGSGGGYLFDCIVHEDCPTSMSKSANIPFVEGDIVGVKIDFSTGKCIFIHNGKVMEEGRGI